MRLVGLMGAEQVGKSTTAAFLRDKGFETISFAAPFKRMLLMFGLSFEQLYGCSKETPCPLLGGKTPRHAMQSIGSEWGRHLIYDDIWVDAVRRDLIAATTEDPDSLFMIEDVRFENEINMIRELGGEIWLVRRSDVEPKMDAWTRLLRWIGFKPRLHRSSMGWARMTDADRLLWNDGTKLEFEHAVERAFNDWRKLHYLRGEPVPAEDEMLASMGNAPDLEGLLMLGEADLATEMPKSVRESEVDPEKHPEILDVALQALKAEIVQEEPHETEMIEENTRALSELWGEDPVADAAEEVEQMEEPVNGATLPAITTGLGLQATSAEIIDGAALPPIVAVLKPIYLGEVSAETKARDEATAQAALAEMQNASAPDITAAASDEETKPVKKKRRRKHR